MNLKKIKVRVPATISSLGSGLHSIGMALSIHSHISLQVRTDNELSVSVTGDETDKIASDVENLALRAAIRVFQQLEDAPLGLHVEVHNAIPFGFGLGEKTALVVGGLVAAHNLIETPLTRDDLVRIAMSFNLPYEGIVACMLGSLSVVSSTTEEPFVLAYDTVETPPLRAIILAPSLPNYDGKSSRFPSSMEMTKVIRHMRHATVMLQALSKADFKLLKQALTFNNDDPQIALEIPQLEKVREAAKKAGAAGVVLAGDGNILIAFTEDEHFTVLNAMQNVFQDADVNTRHWVLPIDRQGVVISAIKESEDPVVDDDGEEEKSPQK